jgi:2'-5' RNA ligase
MRVRTFIAVEFDEDIRRSAYDLGQGLGAGLQGIKWVEPQNIHLTLKFLGDVDGKDIGRVCAEADAAAASVGSFDVEAQGVGTFPPRGNPRVVWVGLTGGTEPLLSMHDQLNTRLTALGIRQERKRFVPHVTIARVRGKVDRSLLLERIDQARRWCGGDQRIHELVVFGSELSPAGPIYTVMGRSPLAKSPSDG